MNISGKLELIIGPMFSGKSSELIKHVRLFKIINKKVLILKPILDTRYDANRIVSHNNEKEDCLVTDDLSAIDKDTISNYDIIIIDEGQFFKNLKTNVLCWIEELNKHIIIGGLDGDFQRNPIGEILDLIPYADSYTKYTALCKTCNNGTKAIFSKRICTSENQVLIGSTDSYIAVCRYHYLHT
jgi:thymidine kinase